jgi:hypothetical protein
VRRTEMDLLHEDPAESAAGLLVQEWSKTDDAQAAYNGRHRTLELDLSDEDPTASAGGLRIARCVCALAVVHQALCPRNCMTERDLQSCECAALVPVLRGCDGCDLRALGELDDQPGRAS